MDSAIIDTCLLLDYLSGDARAEHALRPYAHRCISVVTWLELLSVCPPQALVPTRGFLRSFERLSVSEAIADEALRLVQRKPGLDLRRALTWASAKLNQLPWVTVDPEHVDADDRGIVMPYRRLALRSFAP